LQRLLGVNTGSSEWLRFNMQSCNHCNELHALYVEHVALEADKNGDMKENSSEIISGFLVSRQENELLRNLKPIAPETQKAENSPNEPQI